MIDKFWWFSGCAGGRVDVFLAREAERAEGETFYWQGRLREMRGRHYKIERKLWLLSLINSLRIRPLLLM